MPPYVFGVYNPIESNPPETLVLVAQSLAPGVEDQAYTAVQFQATGGVLPYTWSLVSPYNSLPPGMSFSGGLLSGTPTSAGSFELVFRVTDNVGTAVDTGIINFQIGAAGQFLVTTTSLPPANRGVSYNQTLQSIGGNGAITWAMVAPNNVLPTGLSLSGSTISGIPTVAGAVSVNFRATDSSAATADSGIISLTVNQVAALSITTIANLPSIEEDVAYSRTFQTSGGWGDVDWTKLSGDYPTGVTLDGETGILSGTPTTIEDTVFTLRATDSEGRTADKTFSLQVRAAGLEGPHDFYGVQIARPEILAGENVGYFSLRTDASLIASGVAWPSGVWSYVFGTGDENNPFGIDAAKVIMPHSLSTADQVIINLVPYNIVDGKILIVLDFMHSQECVSNVVPNSGLTHKWIQIEGGPRTNGSGGLWIEPRQIFRATGDVGPKNLRTYFTSPFLTNFGLVKGDPYEPTGSGAVPVDQHLQRPNVLCREWFEVQPSVPGTSFTEWNAAYSTVNAVGTSDIHSVTIDGADTVLEVDTGETYISATKPSRNSWPDAHNGGTADGTGCTITIAGNSNPALNGIHEVTVDDFTHLRIVGLAATGTGGTASKHFAMFSWWHAEEDMEPFRMLYKVPIMRVGPGQVTDMRFELNTSKDIDAMKGFFITSPPSQANPTVIEIGPHDIQTGDSVWSYLCPSIPTRAYLATRVSDTEISLPVNVTTEATIYPPGQNPIDRLNLGDIASGDTFTITFRDDTTTPITFESDMTSTIQAAMRALPGQSTAIVTKVSNQVYDVEFRTTRTTLLQITNVTGFTSGGVTRVQVGISQSYLSGYYGRIVKPLVMYTRNLVFLRNLDADESDTTLFKKPIRGV